MDLLYNGGATYESLWKKLKRLPIIFNAVKIY